MANVRKGSIFYVDTQYSGASHELDCSGKKVTVHSVLVTATSANAVFVLGDGSQPLAEYRVAAAGTSELFDYNQWPFRVGDSIRPITVTNARVSIVLREEQG